MNSATKSILKATVAVHKKEKDGGKMPSFAKKQIADIEKTNLYKARGTSSANHHQAYSIFLRIYKNDKMEKQINHAEREHALLSASGASRWMACTPSAKLEEKVGNVSSSFAEEGTLAHEIAELQLKHALKLIDNKTLVKQSEPLTANSYYSNDMVEYVQKHVDYVVQQFTEAKRLTPDATLLIEERLSIEFLTGEKGAKCTCDVIVIANGTLEVIDLKYGAGVRVEAENNSQLKLYALAALEGYELLYSVDNVRVTVTQPRMDSISSWETSAEDLRQWGDEVVKPKALEALAGKGEQVTGPHCQFCKVAARCKAQLKLAEEIAKKAYSDEDIELISDEELIDIYAKMPTVTKWLDKVKDFMYQEAVNGKKWAGYKLVDGQSRRAWTDEEAAENILRFDYDPEMYLNTKLKGIGDIEKLVGKKEFPALLGEVVGFKKTAPSLVPDSDKRPAMGIDQAKMDYSDDI